MKLNAMRLAGMATSRVTEHLRWMMGMARREAMDTPSNNESGTWLGARRLRINGGDK